MLVAHGEADNVVPLSEGRRVASSVRRLAPDAAVDFRTYSGMGHSTCDEQVSDLRSTEERLQSRVDELEVAVPATKNAELVNQLRRTQAELIAQLTELKSEGGLDPLPSGPALSTSSSAAALAAPGSLVALAQAEKEELQKQIAQLEQQLEEAKKGSSRPSSAGGSGSKDVKYLSLQVRELEAELGRLERERSVLTRRATYAEEQLSAMQTYVDTYMGKYQTEIMRLKQAPGR